MKVNKYNTSRKRDGCAGDYKKQVPARFLTKRVLFLLFIAFAIIVLIGGWHTFNLYKHFEADDSQHHRIIELNGIITHFDEVLTMSARMTAATGELKWQERYRRFEPRLDEAIKEVKRLAPRDFMRQAAQQTDAANIKLVAMENQSFDLVRQGNLQAANKLLYSREYEKQKRLYSGGMEQYIAGLQRHIVDSCRSNRNIVFAAVVFVAFIVSLAIFSLIAMLQMRSHLFERKWIQRKLEAANQRLESEVAERKQAEAAIKTESKRAEQYFDIAEVGLVAVNADERIVRINKKGCETLGYKEEELRGKNWFEVLVPQRVREEVSGVFGKLMAGEIEPVEYYENPLLTKDGEERQFAFHNTVVRDSDGRIAGVLFSAEDITERKQMEKDARQLAVVTEQAVEGIAVVDLEGNLQYVNQSWAAMHGYDSGDELVGRNLNIFHTDQQLKSDVIPFNDKVKQYGYNLGEVGHMHKDGTTFTTMMNVTLLKDEQGAPYAIAGFVQDITKRKQAEKQQARQMEELKAARRATLNIMEKLEKAKCQAESADIAKSRFLANMSHEIRTPMNAIIGLSDLLADEELTNEQKQEVNTIRESGYNLLRLINDILDFSKIEAGQLDVETIEFSLAKILNFIESMMKFRAKGKGIEFEIIESNGLPAKIKSDPMRINQCLVNLIGNAVKFTAKGYVHLNVSLEERQDKPFIRFDIEDTGTGIAEDKQEVIFESFTQADGGTTRKYGGTGLGLAITKQLAGLLGGELTLTSQVGKGSVFSLVIPAGVDISSQPFMDRNNIAGHWQDSSDKMVKRTFSGNVLVAEDVRTNQILMRLLLGKMGLKVTIAGDGREALQKALTQCFDIILMDIQMPKMDGYEAAKALRANGITTPIIALTASVMKGDDVKYSKAVCDGYLQKPIDGEKLDEILKKYLPSSSREQRRPAGVVDESAQSEAAQGDIKMGGNIINWDKLSNILEDEEEIKAIMPVYIADNREHLEGLCEAVKSGDSDSIRWHGHAIKGAGRNLGADRLSDIASEMECAGKENDVENARGLLEGLKAEFDKLVTFLSQPDWIEKAKEGMAVAES